MNIKVLSDSTCDLSEEIKEKFDITTVPLVVNKNGVSYRDCVDITPADIFAHVAAGGDLCSTSALNVGDYENIFAKYAPEYDGVVYINLGSGFSCCHQNALLAAEDYPNVVVIDSKNLSTGQGLVVLKAAELAKTCEDLQDLKAQLDEFTGKVEASFLLDQLAYMVKGGRCSSVAALGANLLNLKPCIEVRDGKMSAVKKYRGNFNKSIVSYVKDRLANRDDIDKGTLFVTKTPVSDEAYNGVLEAVKEYGDFENIYYTDAGCTVSCHCGPGTLGVLFVRK